MGLATHLGPWLLGTVRNTTGTTAGNIKNLGATVVTQSFDIVPATFVTTTCFAIPAGSLVLQLDLLKTVSTTGTSPAITFNINGTAITASSAINSLFDGYTPPDTITPGPYQGFLNSISVGLLLRNVGTTDATFGYTVSGTYTAGRVTAILRYIVRNPDGTIV